LVADIMLAHVTFARAGGNVNFGSIASVRLWVMNDQEVKGAAAQPHRFVALQQETLCCKEPVRVKRDGRCATGCCLRLSHDRECLALPEAASPR
jgi:hypothetical protein